MTMMVFAVQRLVPPSDGERKRLHGTGDRDMTKQRTRRDFSAGPAMTAGFLKTSGISVGHRNRAKTTHQQKSLSVSLPELLSPHRVRILCPMVQQSEVVALFSKKSQYFTDILVQFPKHFNHQMVFRASLADGKSHLPYLLAVNAWKGLQCIPRPALPHPFRCFPAQRIREELLEVIMNSVCASLQVFDSVRTAVCAERSESGCPSRRWSPVQMRWCPQLC